MSGAAPERVCLRWLPFSFSLPVPLQTAAGALSVRRGWLLRLERSDGACGWGEASPLTFGPAVEAAWRGCGQALESLGTHPIRDDLERRIPALPPALAFALGAALAEVDGLVGPAAGGWRPAPPAAWLLPAGPQVLGVARTLLATSPPQPAPGALPLTLKWKIGVHPAAEEHAWYRELVALLPPDARLRLDANGGLDRATASLWADQLEREERLQWLEQPLAPEDHEGLEALARRLPLALDESLLQHPEQRRLWQGWQVRRPSQEGDPRPLLGELRSGRPHWMVSTGFETGIGRRWIAHLAALQVAGPTPVAPGLAPGWEAPGDLGADVPERVWQAAEGS